MIEIKNLHKAFGQNQVLKGVDITVNKGDVVVVIGPSGSGKTTMLRCINFLERADEGTITVGDITVDAAKAKKKEIHEIRLRTAMVFQNYNLFANKTALGNVMEGLTQARGVSKEKAKEIAALAAIISTNFTKYFIMFHHMFFTNDLWILDPTTDMLINIVPEGFFMDTAGRIAFLFGALSLILFGICLIMTLKNKRR